MVGVRVIARGDEVQRELRGKTAADNEADGQSVKP